MTRLVFNRDGGKTDEYGHMIGFSWHIQGDVLGGLVVTPTNTPGMSVKVDSGIAALPRNSDGKMYRIYCGLDAPETLTIPTANTSNPRIDTVVLYVDMKVTPTTGVTNNSNNMCKLMVVQGAPSSNPQGASDSQIQSAVGAGNPFIGLSKVRVDAGVTQITYGKCVDIRDFASPGFVDGRFMKDKSINFKGYGDSSIGRNAIDWAQFNENKYSTSEINTNKTFIDGKPIYRKVFRFNTTGNGQENGFADGTFAMVDSLINFDAVLNMANGERYPNGYTNPAAPNLQYFQAKLAVYNGVQQLRYNTRSDGTALVIMEYTKR